MRIRRVWTLCTPAYWCLHVGWFHVYVKRQRLTWRFQLDTPWCTLQFWPRKEA
jgi:hypothetical protein